MSKFNANNWNFCQYQHEDKKAIISFGAENLSDSTEELKFCYFITVLDEDNNQLFQQRYHDLEKACLEINEKYENFWKFVDLEHELTSKTGCSSCQAH